MSSSTSATGSEEGAAASESQAKSGPQIIEEVATRVQEGVNRILGDTSASTVFGKPEKVGDRVIITAAAVQRAGGFGFGGGGGEEEGETKSVGAGGGGGGGGGTEGRPVAVIEITPETVKVRPVFDATKIGLALFTSVLGVFKIVGRTSGRPDRPWDSWSRPSIRRRQSRRQRLAPPWW